jgi:hypothetical protein
LKFHTTSQISSSSNSRSIHIFFPSSMERKDKSFALGLH